MTAYSSAAYALILWGGNEAQRGEVICLRPHSYQVAESELECRFLSSQLRLYLSPPQDVPSQFSKMKAVSRLLLDPSAQAWPRESCFCRVSALGKEMPALVSSRPGPGSDSLGRPPASLSGWSRGCCQFRYTGQRIKGHSE